MLVNLILHSHGAGQAPLLGQPSDICARDGERNKKTFNGVFQVFVRGGVLSSSNNFTIEKSSANWEQCQRSNIHYGPGHHPAFERDLLVTLSQKKATIPSVRANILYFKQWSHYVCECVIHARWLNKYKKISLLLPSKRKQIFMCRRRGKKWTIVKTTIECTAGLTRANRWDWDEFNTDPLVLNLSEIFSKPTSLKLFEPNEFPLHDIGLWDMIHCALQSNRQTIKIPSCKLNENVELTVGLVTCFIYSCNQDDCLESNELMTSW